MKLVKSSFAAVAAAACTLIAGQALAARPPVYFRAPMEFKGTGCPGQNSVSIIGENTDTLTIMFDQYDAANPPKNAVSKLKRSACSFSVPVHVPQGFQMSIMTADWRGYAEGSTALHREYFFAGQRGPRKDSKPRGDFVITDKLKHATFSPCGAGDVTLRINSSVRAQSDPSYIAVDTVDLKNKTKVVFHMKWQKCR